MPKLTRTDDELHLSLSGAKDFQDALARVKVIPGRRFDGETKLWKFPRDPAIAERLLLTIKPTADAAILQWVRNSRSEREAELTTKLPDDGTELLIPWADKLYDYQRAAVEFLTQHPRAILADDLGLGKTLQALSVITEYFMRHDEADYSLPKLIACPNSAKGVWAREIVKWLGSSEPHQIVDAKTPKKREQQIAAAIKDGAFCVVNWEQVRAKKLEESHIVQHRDGSTSERTDVSWVARQPLFTETDWLAIIADEAHRAKSRKALVTQGLWLLHAPIQLALTGTPLQNSPDELWSLLKWLYPEQYGKSTPGHPRTAFWAFHDQYTESYEGYGGSRVVVGVKNPDALRFELKNRLVRRTKAEKLNLPEKTREVIPVELNPDQAKIYREAEKDFWLKIEEAVREGDKDATKFAEAVLTGRKKIYEISNGASRVVRLRQIACSPALLGGVDDSAKMDAIIETIVDNSNQQHVVYSEFVQGANLLVERLLAKGIEAEAFTGEVKDTRVRTFFEDKFQNGNIDVLVGTLGAMREAITLTAANVVHFCERSWVPSWNEQAEDRLYRIGQKNAVTVLIYEAQNTVDTDNVRPANTLKELIVSSVIKKDKVREV